MSTNLYIGIGIASMIFLGSLAAVIRWIMTSPYGYEDCNGYHEGFPKVGQQTCKNCQENCLDKGA